LLLSEQLVIVTLPDRRVVQSVPATATLGSRMTTPSSIAIKNFIGLYPSTARRRTRLRRQRSRLLER
jgi:hypothetical protein